MRRKKKYKYTLNRLREGLPKNYVPKEDDLVYLPGPKTISMIKVCAAGCKCLGPWVWEECDSFQGICNDCWDKGYRFNKEGDVVFKQRKKR